MAHNVEPVEIDSDFDNKENSLHHSNVLPFTEKGYEELDVSELNMKLRYSVTPTQSPMSKSYTANCFDNRTLESGDDPLNNTVNDNTNLTRSLNSTITKNDNVLKSLKSLPLQRIQTDNFVDNRSSILRTLASTIDNGNINVTITAPTDAEESLSLPSTVSSGVQTPEATTPTKDGGSPIMRGLKTVLNMFRSSQSPIPPPDNENTLNPLILSPNENTTSTQELNSQMVVSTPICTHKKKEMSPTKRISPIRDSSVTFNDDLEKELQWKDETTIFFSQERIPIHKLLLRQPQTNTKSNQIGTGPSQQANQELNSSVEYMDISYNESITNITMTDIEINDKIPDNTLTCESDSEFVDCETTLTKIEPQAYEHEEKTPGLDEDLDLEIAQQGENKTGRRLKEIILNTTQDILDATLSIKPEDLLSETLVNTKVPTVFNNTDTIDLSVGTVELPNFDQTIINPLSTEIVLEDIDTTKIIETSTTETNDETLRKPDFQEEKMDVINISQTISNDTFICEKQLDVTDNVNTTLIIETHDTKILDAEITLVTGRCSENVVNEANELNNSLPKMTDIEKPIESVPSLNYCKEDIKNPLPIAELNITLPNNEIIDEKAVIPISVLNQSKEAAVSSITKDLELLTQLPSDIPLPDEDELEKELIVDSTANTISCTQSDGIVENVNMTIEISDSTTICTEAADNTNVLNNSNETVLPEGNTSEDQSISNKTITILDIESNKNINDIEECKNYSNQLEPVIQNEEVASMNITQNICSLPDIVNQTITLNKTEQLENITLQVLNTEVAEPPITSEQLTITPKEVDIKLDYETKLEKHNSSNSGLTNEEINRIQQEPLTLPTQANVCEISQNNEIPISESTKDTKDITIDFKLVNPIPVETDNIYGNSQEVDEELVLSENNSPFVSVSAENIPENLDEILSPLDVIDNLISKDEVPTSNSPPISTKGYYFNFDDVNFNPFATKSNMRMLPPKDIPLKSDEDQIRTIETSVPKKARRKSHLDKRKPTPSTKKLNSTFDGSTIQKFEDPVVEIAKIELSLPTTPGLCLQNVTIEEKDSKICDTSNIPKETANVSNITLETEAKTFHQDKIEQPVESATENSDSNNENVNELKTTSSSEQSTYFSAGTSSSDSSIHSRNVFNLPEIDDRNFNPFATKCKIQQSPTSSLHMDHQFINEIKIASSPDNSMVLPVKIGLLEDKIEAELMEKDTSSNLSNTIMSSKATDERNITTREIHTEDEDTVEGPFLDADEIDFSDKNSNFGDNIDCNMQYSELPAQNNVENIDNGEMFIDAEAFEFLLNQNKSNTVVDSGKESLFLKFDPLFAKRMSVIKSDSLVASLAAFQKRESTSNNEVLSPIQKATSPTAGPSNANTSQSVDLNMSEDFNDDLNITVSKPMMVVPPAVNPVTPRNKSLTPNRSNRRSITFTSPAMAVIDRLLSLSMNNSSAHDTTITQVSREQSEADVALSQLRELLAEKEMNVYNLKSEGKELKSRLITLESHLKLLEEESKEKLKKINQLNETLAQKTKMNKSMAAVVEEYERTIASLIAETAQDKKKHAEERMKLTSERDEQTAHLASMEVSFNDIHSKYEKSKQVIFQCKANEDMLKKSIKDFEDNLAKMQNNYELLKQHATSKLNHANQELEKINKSHEAEVLKLNAMIKRKDLHITSLEESLIQKTKANEELTAICDELINKVS